MHLFKYIDGKNKFKWKKGPSNFIIIKILKRSWSFTTVVKLRLEDNNKFFYCDAENVFYFKNCTYVHKCLLDKWWFHFISKKSNMAVILFIILNWIEAYVEI